MVTLLGLLSVVPSRAADAPPVEPISCEQPIDHSLRAKNDLFCPGTALFVTAPNITIDLNGHRLVGDAGTGDVGIENATGCAGTEGCDGVKILNGFIGQFGTGVSIADANENVVRDLVVTDAPTFGVHLANSKKSAVADITAVGNGIGIGLADGSSANTIEDNTVAESTSQGIGISSAPTNTITGNRVAGNAAGIVTNSSTQTKITSNRVLGNTGSGISVTASSLAAIKKNTVRGNGSFGIGLDNADNASIAGNNVTAQALSGIAVDNDSDTAKISDNISSANDTSGVIISADSDGAKVLDNKTHENGLHGIETLAPASTTIDGNAAHRNGFLNDKVGNGTGLGIAGGGGTSNKASGNDDTDECDPTACSAGAPPAGQLIGCGEDVVASLRVANNISCTSTSGLEVKAPDVEVDLGGHRISGDLVDNDSAVRNIADCSGSGCDGVIVRNGVIANWDLGVDFSNVDGSLVTRLLTTGNTEGMNILGGDSTFRKNEAAGNVRTFAVSGGTNDVTRNTIYGGIGGLTYTSGIDGSTISKNRIVLAGFVGISLDGASGNVRAAGNTIEGSYSSAALQVIGGMTNIVEENTTRGSGIWLFQSTGNAVKNNTVIAANIGITVFSAAADNVIKGNSIRAGFHGIWIQTTAGDTNQVVSNLVVEAEGDGIQVDKATTAVRKNEALRNGFAGGIADGGGYGIDAPVALSANDGNVAKGNDHPDQCNPDSLC